METSNRKKKLFITAGLLGLFGLLAVVLFYNRRFFYPEVQAVTSLQIKLEDTLVVNSGIRVQNMAPFSFQIDSLAYQITHKGEKLGWGKQQLKQTLPALKSETFNLQIFLHKERYKKLLKTNQNQDSLALDVAIKIYLKPPFFGQQTVQINRSISTAIPQTPALQIDSFFVKSFSPEAGYVFQLNLNTQNINLPNLQLENLQYNIRLSDSITLSGKIDTVLNIKSQTPKLEIPIHLKTAELIEALALKLSPQKKWPYEARATATLKAGHHLFENTAVSVSRSGTLDTRRIGGSTSAMPSVKNIKSLQLVAKEKSTFLEAEVQIHNPVAIPLYLDSARYLVRSGGKVIAFGGDDHEKTLPAANSQTLKLHLAVNNRHYQQLLSQPKNGQKIPLEVELLLHYNLKKNQPQQIAIKKKINVPVTESPKFQFIDIGVKELDPDKGAALFVKLKAENKNQTKVQLDDLNYRLNLKNGIDLAGKTQKPIVIDTGTTEIEIPVNLSGPDLNQIAKGLIQGVETWPYTFRGTALISTPNSFLHRTEVELNTSGVYKINSKGSPDFMPEISKIDTLNVSIRYDTAWAHMYAAIYNTLPATIHLTQLQVDIIHEQDTVGKTEENLDLPLAPETNSFAWHTVGVNYGLWEEHVTRNQHQDSILLNLPVSLYFNLGNLGKEKAELDLSTKIPTPASPVVLLQKLLIRGFSFRHGLKFNAVVAVQNANSPGLTVKNIEYNIRLENGVDLCGKVNREYKIPLGISEVKVPINLSIWESLKLLKRQFFGPPLLQYKINATAQLRTDNPKLSNVFVIFENHNQTNLKEKKTLKARPVSTQPNPNTPELQTSDVSAPGK